MRELRRDRGKPRALLHLLAQPLGDVPHFLVLRRVVDREKDLGDPALRLADMLLDPLQRVVDLAVRDRRALHGLALDQLRPYDRRGQLVDQRAAVDAARLHELVERARLHVVLLLDLVERLVDLVVGRGHVLPLGFLQLQFLVDQRTQHLPGDALPVFRGVGNAGGDQHHADARDQVEGRDHLVVDDRGDLHVRRRRRARLSPCRLTPPRQRRRLTPGWLGRRLRRRGGGRTQQQESQSAKTTKPRHRNDQP